MLSRLRKVVGPVQNGLAAPFVKANVSATTVTLLALPLSLTSALLCVAGLGRAALAFAIASVLMDFLDGAVARCGGQNTAFGNQLDAVVDRVVEGFLLAGLAYHYPVASAIALTLGTTVSYIKARAGLVVVSDNSDWPGMGDRADRVALILIALWAHASSLQLWGLAVAGLVLWLLALVSGIGCVQRLFFAKKLIEAGESEGRLLPYLSKSDTSPS